MSTTTRTNAREQHCENCRTLVAPGAGSLTWNPGQDDGGWGRARYEVVCLDAEACAANKAALIESMRADVAAQETKRREEAAASDARSAEILARAKAVVAEHGLEQVDPHKATVSVPAGAKLAWSDSERPGFGKVATVAQVYTADAGTFVVLGDSYSTVYAPPALVRAGEAQYRIGKYWTLDRYGVRNYPGPAVPDAELTPEELAQVNAWRAAKDVAEAEEKVTMRRRVLNAYIDGAPVVQTAKRCGAVTLGVTDEHYEAFERGEVVTVPMIVRLGPENYSDKGRLIGAAKKSLSGGPYYCEDRRRVWIAVTLERAV